jgi:hypothetical protein
MAILITVREYSETKGNSPKEKNPSEELDWFVFVVTVDLGEAVDGTRA